MHMNYARVLLLAGIVTVCAHSGVAAQGRSQSESTVAGRQVSCGNIRIRFDRDLPNLGAAATDSRLLVLNPRLLKRETAIVQLFVFNHECGHHNVGGSELAADCWAIGKGVREGWLDTKGVGEVCRSFEDAPETSTHPSGRRRCANLDRCFATSTTEVARERNRVEPAKPTLASAPGAAPNKPRLVSAPRLLWTGGG